MLLQIIYMASTATPSSFAKEIQNHQLSDGLNAAVPHLSARLSWDV
jgi:hypothetical protein